MGHPTVMMLKFERPRARHPRSLVTALVIGVLVDPTSSRDLQPLGRRSSQNGGSAETEEPRWVGHHTWTRAEFLNGEPTAAMCRRNNLVSGHDGGDLLRTRRRKANDTRQANLCRRST